MRGRQMSADMANIKKKLYSKGRKTGHSISQTLSSYLRPLVLSRNDRTSNGVVTENKYTKRESKVESIPKIPESGAVDGADEDSDSKDVDPTDESLFVIKLRRGRMCSEKYFPPDEKSARNFLQRATLRHLSSKSYPSLKYRNYLFVATKPDFHPLPEYYIDKRSRNTENKILDPDEDDVKKLFITSPTERLRRTNSKVDFPGFLVTSFDTCKKKFLEETGNALKDDGVFWRYNPKYKYKKRKISEEHSVSQPSQEAESMAKHKLLFCVESLHFAVGDFEPMYCSIWVLDLRHKRRVSETLRVAFNDPDDLKRILSTGVAVENEDLGKKFGMLTINSEPHHFMYLMVRIERVLQGESSQQDNLYLKGAAMKKAMKDMIQRKTMMTIRRLQSFRQPFCWGFLPLFNTKGESLHRTKAIGKGKHIEPLFFQLEVQSEDNFYKTVREVVLEQKKPSKIIQGGSLKLQILSLNRRTPRILDLRTVSGVESDPPVTKLLEFLPEKSLARPHAHFVNNLYIYVKHCQFTKHRNIAVKVEVRETDTKLESEGLPWIWDRDHREESTHFFLPVNYHVKKPFFDNEVKIRLPLQLSRQAHLFFTFFNVSCKRSKKTVKEIVGYSVLSLYSGNMLLNNKTYSLSIAEKLPDNYMIPYESGDSSKERGIKFRFGGERKFFLTTRVVSSMYSTDPGLNEFINSWPTQKELAHLTDEKGVFMDILLDKSLQHLNRAKPRAFIRFLPGLLDFLHEVVATWDHGRIQAFRATLIVVDAVNKFFKNDDGELADVLAQYAQHTYQDTDTSFSLYVNMMECWTSELKTQSDLQTEISEANIEELEKKKDAYKLVLKCSVYLFEVTFKSVVNDFVQNGPTNRLDGFIETFGKLVNEIRKVAKSHRTVGRFLLQNIINSFAKFLVKLFDIVDHGKVIELIGRFIDPKVSNMDSVDTMDAVLVDLKADFLHIVLIDNKNTLKIINPSRTSKKWNEAKSSNDDILTTIAEANPFLNFLIEFSRTHLTSEERTVQEKIVALLQGFMEKIDYDSRYQDPETRSQISTMFAPLLEVIIENVTKVPQLHSISISTQGKTRHLRNILACALWILKGLDSNIRMLWWSKEDPDYLSDFVSVLQDAIQAFEYPSLLKRKREATFDCILSASTVSEIEGEEQPDSIIALKKDVENLYTQKANRKVSLREFRARFNRSARKRGARSNTLTTSSREYLLSVMRLESGMSVIVSRIVLLTLRDLLEYAPKLIHPQQESVNLCSSVISLITSMLSTHQTTEMWISVLHILHLFIAEYGVSLFQLDHFKDQIGSLTLAILTLCKWQSDDLCTGSISAVYALLKANFKATSNIDRMQIALTVSMSKLVAKLHTNAKSKWANFAKDFDLLTKRMGTILQGSIDIRKQEALSPHCDATTIEHLIMSIAGAFVHIPDIQIEHLKRLAEFQRHHKNYAEAGYCYLTMADLYETKLRANPTKLPQSSVSLELRIRSCYGEACEMLDNARLYEECNRAYAKLIPMLEKRKNWNELASAHAHLHKIFTELDVSEQKNDRLLGTYFRVGFYGKSFGDRDGKEFVYKKPLVTHLVEIVGEMRTIYSDLLKEEVEIIADSREVDISTIDDSKNFLQITYLHPHFANPKSRTGFIERNTNIKSFVFSTPFTAEGKARGDVTEQCKRKTIVHVETAFPCCQTTQLIVRKTYIILSPLESAIEDVNKRTEKTMKVLNNKPVSIKALSAVLQGSVATQVNGGAIEICQAFLADKEAEHLKKYGSKRLNALKRTLRQFLRACQKGLDKMTKQTATSEDGKEDPFLEHLVKSFETMTKMMKPHIVDNDKRLERGKSKRVRMSDDVDVRLFSSTMSDFA
eukprot:jgi/Bigna1/136600/aug1.34_g11308